jgi:protein-disulfide isomerase
MNCVSFVRSPLFIVLLGVCAPRTSCGQCISLSDTMKTSLGEYLRAEDRLDNHTSVFLLRDATVGDSCFRRLVYRLETGQSLKETEIYLSPDQRFVARHLFELRDRSTRAPVVGSTKMADLVGGSPPILGPNDAAITIVEFIDFQCPYCKRLTEEIESKIMPTHGSEVRLVIRQMPLPEHAWALASAKGAVCAQHQSNEAFWAMHDFLFVDQDRITEKNIHERLLQYAKLINHFDINQFRTCIETDASLDEIRKDVDLGFANEVQATPTCFINGRRVEGFVAADQMLKIFDAIKSQRSSTVGTN